MRLQLPCSLRPEELVSLLARVGVACRDASPGVLACRVPSHRNDLHLPEDLNEEAARIHGYARIPTTEPVGVLRPVALPPLFELADRARDILAAAGADLKTDSN